MTMSGASAIKVTAKLKPTTATTIKYSVETLPVWQARSVREPARLERSLKWWMNIAMRH